MKKLAFALVCLCTLTATTLLSQIPSGTGSGVNSVNTASGDVILRVGPGLKIIQTQSEISISIDTAGALIGQGMRFNGTRWVAGDLVPIGTVMAFAGEDAQLPDGWLYCDGNSVRRKDFARLYDVIGLTYGNVQGSQFFNLPDYRGMFLRGVDTSYALNNASGRDIDRAKRTPHPNGNQVGNRVGSMQDDAFQGHVHLIATSGSGYRSYDEGGDRLPASGALHDEHHPKGGYSGGYGCGLPTFPPPTSKHAITPDYKQPRLSLETRSKNVSVHWIIKAR